MSWFGKKKPNPEDGDFPHVSKHYREEKTPTRTVRVAPPLQWNGPTTSVIWGIDIGAGSTTVSFAYLEPGCDVEVHNIIYWPKEFPLRESSAAGLALPDLKSNKTFKTREVYTSTGFVSHAAWTSEKVSNYLYLTDSTSLSAFQARTEVPILESSERHKFNDLVEQLLKHALGVYGAVIKPSQPRWSQASDLVITLPSGLPKSAEMAITGALDRSIGQVMPKVIGPTRSFYVRKPDVRLFEDDLWRNIDTTFRHEDVFMLVEWDLASGSMMCTSYKAIQSGLGCMMFGTRLRSFIEALPAAGKRDVAIDEREGVRFANALNWCAINKHRVQKLIVRTSNPMKKSEKLLDVFHKTLVDNDLQVGLRPIDPLLETGAFGAVIWRVAHVNSQSQDPDGVEPALVQDMTKLSSEEVNAQLQQPLLHHDPEPKSRMSRAFNSLSIGVLGLGDKKAPIQPSPLNIIPELAPTPFVSSPAVPAPLDTLPSPSSIRTPQTPTAGTGSAFEIAHTSSTLPGPSQLDASLDAALDEELAPPAYTNRPGGPGYPSEKRRMASQNQE